MTFSHLPSPLAEALTTKGYAALTPVQSSVVEPEALGRDLIVSAQTGSGKTVAFGLAMAAEMLDEQGRVPPAGAPLALIIAPTRELALQVSRELVWLYGPTGARITTCVGGMDASKERRALGYGAQIVVGTPGRLRDHLERGALDLSSLRVAVLDEADEMLDMGFREDLEGILDTTPEGRRTLLFSATMPKPIIALARRYQNDALRISTIGEDRGHGDISYQAVTVAPNDIENAVVNLLRFHDAPTAMLFCGTRDNVRHLHASLVERGFDAVALSGEHSQQERNHALQALRDQRARICVATDVAARGIDLPTLSLVIHVELPRDAETLQHRSGRTGRAGKKGTAVLLIPYPRRKRVEMMLRGAKINAEWLNPPTLADINKADRSRLIEALLAPVECDEEDRALAEQLMAQRTPEDIAAMLVRMHRAKMPQPEELLDATSAPPRDGPRAGFESTQWFSIAIGREHNADARWILPLLCRRGHIGREDIGAIRINANDTMFEIKSASAARFMDSVKRTTTDTDDENGAAIVAVAGAPRSQERGGRDDRPQRRTLKRSNADGPRPAAPRAAKPWGDSPRGDGKPFRKNPSRPKSDHYGKPKFDSPKPGGPNKGPRKPR